MSVLLPEKRTAYPRNCPDGQAIKSLPQALLERSSLPHFKPETVPDEYLEAILQFGAQGLAGHNLQPWRFLVVRNKDNRERLRCAAFDQQAITDAPVVIIAFAVRENWQNNLDTAFDDSVVRRFGKLEKLPGLKQQAAQFLERQLKQMSQAVWMNRHTMIAVTTMMLVAETYGLEAAPLEGFDPVAICREFGLPEKAEVVALLAVGFGQQPHNNGTRKLDLSEFVFDEHFGRRWSSQGRNPDLVSQEMFEEIQRKEKEPIKPA